MKTIVLSFALLFSGCSATLTSRDIVLDLKPDQKITIGSNKDAIDVSKAAFLTKYSNYKSDVQSALLAESKGLVSELADQPLILSLSLQFQPQFRADDFIGITSFFLPFLAFVSETSNETYSVDYAIKDRYGNVAHQRSLKGTVEGSMSGYFIGRLDATETLKQMEAEYVSKNAARLVLKDIEENSEKLFAAAHVAPGARHASLERATPSAPEKAGVSEPVTEDLSAYQEAKSLNTFDGYAEFLRAHPASSCRRDALAAMGLIIKKQKSTYEDCRKFVVEFADGIEFVPSPHRLALIGPEGTRVRDILGLLKQGIEDTVIAAKIRMQNAVYKDFNYEEIRTLKTMGMTGVLIESMLDSTTRAKREQGELQKKKEMEDLLAEIQRTQKKLDAMKTAQESQQVQASASAGQGTDPSLGDAVKNCTAQIAALEGCKHLPWPANSVCGAAAKSQFPCQ
jgi:hypothetical protein